MPEAEQIRERIERLLRRHQTGLTSKVIHRRVARQHPYLSIVSQLAHMVRQGVLRSNGPKGEKVFTLTEARPSSWDRLDNPII